MNSSPSSYPFQATVASTSCPYCSRQTQVQLPQDYSPAFAYCDHCREKFIVERRAQGFTVMTLQEAPRCSNPDCRAIEMGGGQEE